jgi:hypothetical protein
MSASIDFGSAGALGLKARLTPTPMSDVIVDATTMSNHLLLKTFSHVDNFGSAGMGRKIGSSAIRMASKMFLMPAANKTSKLPRHSLTLFQMIELCLIISTPELKSFSTATSNKNEFE